MARNRENSKASYLVSSKLPLSEPLSGGILCGLALGPSPGKSLLCRMFM